MKFILYLKYSLFLLLLPLYTYLHSEESAKRLENDDVEFRFKSSSSFANSVLKEVLLLPREKYFDRNTFEEDRQRLKKFYFDNGFFDVLIDTATAIDMDESTIDLIFKINENERYTIKEIQYEFSSPLNEVSARDIYSSPLVRAGEPYIKQYVSMEKDRIVSILQNNGYYKAFTADTTPVIVAKYSGEIQKDQLAYRHKVMVKLRFKGTEKQYYFGKTKINIISSRYELGKDIIERELEYEEGQLFNKSKVLESENNFSRLAIIQNGRLEVDTSMPEDNRVNYIANITLGRKYEFIPGIAAIYFTNKLFGAAELEYRDKNFFGGGRIFTTTLEGRIHDFGNNGIKLSFSFTQPYLFNNNISLTFTPSIGLLNYNDSTEYVYSSNLLRTSYYIAPYTFYQNAYFDLSVDFNRERFKEDKVEDGIPYKKGDIVNSMNSVVGVTLIHNSANDLFNPSKGGYHSLTLENTGFLPALISLFKKNIDYSQYVKFYVPSRYYRDVSGNASEIVAINLEVGDIIEYGSGENIVPINKLYKFYSGGGSSVRGWYAQENGILEHKDEGGTFLLEGSMEYRWNIWYDADSFTKNFWLVGFWDYGNVWESDGLFRFSQIAMAAGIGLRYNTFVGPVRIDFGFKLFDPDAPEGRRWLLNKSRIFVDKFAFHFGLGNAF